MLVRNLQDIEDEARRLQIEIWDHQASLWPGRTLAPLEMFTPQAAARVLDIKYECGDLGLFGSRDGRYAPAGVLDRQRGLIAVADSLPLPVQRFTGAHEVGHWLLHEGMVMHRDRPIAGVPSPRLYRPVEERDADYFAACYLVPRKLLLKAVLARFGTSQLRLDEDVAFFLGGSGAETLLTSDVTSLDYPLAVASAQSFAGRHFDSLTKIFDVTVTTMAIRLVELNMVIR